MSDIEHELLVAAPVAHVFDAFATSAGLDTWWTETSSADPRPGGRYTLGFGPGYAWTGIVRTWDPPHAIEWEMTETDPMPDWTGTRVGVSLTPEGEATRLQFWHRGWAGPTPHFRVSSYCWATLLRLLARNRVSGEVVPYARRNDA